MLFAIHGFAPSVDSAALLDSLLLEPPSTDGATIDQLMFTSMWAHSWSLFCVWCCDRFVWLSAQVCADNCTHTAILFASYLHRLSFLPARRYASAGNSDRNVSVRPSVCLSVTRRYCVKMKKASGMISSPSGSPRTLVFWCQMSSPNSRGSHRTGPQTRVGRKNSAIF